MSSFKDAQGREWKIAITYGLCRRLKSELAEKQIDILEPLLPRGVDPKSSEAATGSQRPSLFAEIQTDLLLFYDVLEAIVGPQLTAAGVSRDGDAGFGEAMAGENLFAAQQAFFAEWIDFFRSLHRPENVAAMEKTANWWRKGIEAAKAKIEDPRIDQAIERKIDAAMSSEFGRLLESPDLTQPTEP